MLTLVRIRAIPETTALGLAGRVGEVYGWSVPSTSGVEPIIGPVPDDFVLSVFIEELDVARTSHRSPRPEARCHRKNKRY